MESSKRVKREERKVRTQNPGKVRKVKCSGAVLRKVD